MFVKASKIAKDYGYTADYIGQLCRSGRVDAQLVGRSWYAALDSLEEHRANRYKKITPSDSEPKAGYEVTLHTNPTLKNTTELTATETKESSQTVKAEPLTFVKKSFYNRVPHYTKTPAAYLTDDSDLIPETNLSKVPENKPKAGNLSIELAEANPVLVEAKSDQVSFETTERSPVTFTGSLSVSNLPDEEVVELPNEVDLKPNKVAVSVKAPKEKPMIDSKTVHILAADTSGQKTPEKKATSKNDISRPPRIAARLVDDDDKFVHDVKISKRRREIPVENVASNGAIAVAIVAASLVVAVMLGFQTVIITAGKHSAETLTFSVEQLKATVYGSK